jgi:adenylate kinase family enzyme
MVGSFRRIAVVGAVGCGKTTFARALAKRFDLVHFELDSFKYASGWTEIPDAIFRDRIVELAESDRWVIDGNYLIVRDIVWTRADLVVWLDYSFAVVMGRLLRRTVRRLWTEEELAGGNRESLGRLLSRRSILLWALRSYRLRSRRLEEWLADPRYSHLQVVRLQSPAAERSWLNAAPS